MHKSKSPTPVRLLLAVLALLSFGALSLRADVVYVTAFTGSSLTSSTIIDWNPLGLTTSISTAGSGEISTAPSIPSRTKSVYAWAGDANWRVRPTLGTTGGVYRIEVAHGTVSCSTNVVITAWSPSGTVTASCTNSTVFDKQHVKTAWHELGYITNNAGVTRPEIFFLKTGGWIDNNTGGTPQRLYIDGFKFTLIDLCAGVAGDVSVQGPVAANQTYVNVTGVTAGATNVTVYAGATQIGSTNYAAGFAAGALVVPTTALVKGNSLTAIQTKDGCLSSASTPAIVGGGANPGVKVTLGYYKDTAYQGPIGASTTGTGTAYWLKATGLAQGSGSAPVGGAELPASGCWQTATFDFNSDGELDWLTGFVVNDTDPYAALESIAFTFIAADSGPYDIYVDKIMNGTNIIENFEGYSAGSAVTFLAPNANTSYPDPSATYLPGAVNSSEVSQNNAYDGTNSCRIQWQFKDAANIRWARVKAGAASGAKYPQISTALPITVQFLVLPVGSTTGAKFNGTVGAITNTTPIYQGGTAELGVTVTGSGTYTYAWSIWDTETSTWSPLGGTDRTYSINPVPNAASSRYMVSVDDGGCAKTAEITLTTPVALPVITNQPASIVVQVGSPANTCVGATPTDPLGGAVQYYQWEKADETGTNWSYVVSSLTAICLSEGIPTAQFSDTGSYRVLVQGVNGQVFSRTISLQVVPADVAVGTGDGLRGDYFNLTSWSDTIGAAFANNRSWAGTPALTEVDSNVDFVWGSASPGAGVNADKFGVRWYGQIQPLTSDTYTFNLYCGDGARVWIDKQLVINSWSNQYATSHSATLALTSAKHDILIEYFESTQSATAQLLWNDNGAIISNSCTVPMQQLFANKSTWTPAAVTLDLPADGSSLTLPGTVSLSASVTTNDAIVKSVRFYTNKVALATVTTAPFNYTWTPPAPGTYNVSASVIYNESAFADSAATNTVTVNAILAAPVTITNLIGTTLTYGGGAGSEFVLLQSATVNAAMGTWTPVHTNTATPGTFTVPGPGYYRVESR